MPSGYAVRMRISSWRINESTQPWIMVLWVMWTALIRTGYQVIPGNRLTVVMAPITHDGKGQLLNTNADTIAQEIAKAMADHYHDHLIYSFEKPGYCWMRKMKVP